MVDIERDVVTLANLVRKLEFEYDQFLSGTTHKEPLHTESAVLALIKVYAGRAVQNPAVRFKFNNLVARYNSFRKVWTRRLRERDEGRIIGRPRKASPPPRNEVGTAAPRKDKKQTEQLFVRYKRLRRQSGESTDRLRLENFQGMLAEKVEILKKSKNCEAIEVRLVKNQSKYRIVLSPCRRKAPKGPT